MKITALYEVSDFVPNMFLLNSVQHYFMKKNLLTTISIITQYLFND